MTEISVASAKRRDRRALLAVATQFFVNGVILGSVSPRLPEIRDQVGLTAGQIGFMMSIAGLGGLIGSASTGGLIGRFGTRRVMLMSALMVAVALPMIGVARGPLLLAVGLALILSFDVPVDVAMNLQGSWLSARRPTPVMNRLHGLWSLGTVAGGLVSSRLAGSGVAVRTHFVLASLVLVALLVLISRGLLVVDETSVSTDTPTADGTGQRPPQRRTAARARNVGLLLFALAGFSAVAVESTSIDWSAFRFTDDLGASASQGALAFVAVTGGMTVGRFFGDWAAVRLGKRRLINVAVATAGLGLGAALLIDHRPSAMVGYLAAGFGIAVFLPEVYDRAAKFPGKPGAGLAALTAGLRVSALTVPLLVGLLVTALDTIGLAVAICTLPAVVLFAVVVNAIIDRSSTSVRSGTIPSGG